MNINAIKEKALDLLFPRTVACGLCGIELGERFLYDLCPACTADLDPVREYGCVKCGRRVGAFALEGKCAHCLGGGTVFLGGFSAFTYTEGAQNLVYGLKYNDKPWLAHSMADMMVQGVEALCVENEIQVLVPVPIHKERLAQRGYNQAELLAKWLGKRIGIPCRESFLHRVKDTLPQNQLKQEERRGNLKGAFEAAIHHEDRGIKILLIDDVLTTGHTLNGCGEALLKNGAGGIWVCSFASVTG